MKVEDWLYQIHGARDRVGVTSEQYPDAAMLAFLDIESDGDPRAHRDGSQFWGLLQMGRAAGLDVDIPDTSVLDGEDGDPESEDDFEAFFRLCERYADAHRYDAYGLAVLWKGGVGTCRTYFRQRDAGHGHQSALAHAESYHDIYRLREYLNDYRRELIRWTNWVHEQNENYAMCTSEVIDV